MFAKFFAVFVPTHRATTESHRADCGAALSAVEMRWFWPDTSSSLNLEPRNPYVKICLSLLCGQYKATPSAGAAPSASILDDTSIDGAAPSAWAAFTLIGEAAR